MDRELVLKHIDRARRELALARASLQDGDGKSSAGWLREVRGWIDAAIAELEKAGES